MRQSRSVMLSRDRGKLGERPDLVGAVQAMTARRLHDEDGPFVREIERAIRGGTSPLGLSAAVDDETAVMESVQADPRAIAAAGEPGEFLGRGVGSAGEPDDGRRDRQAELRADAQAHVLGRRLDDRGSTTGGSGMPGASESIREAVARIRSTRVGQRPFARDRLRAGSAVELDRRAIRS